MILLLAHMVLSPQGKGLDNEDVRFLLWISPLVIIEGLIVTWHKDIILVCPQSPSIILFYSPHD